MNPQPATGRGSGPVNPSQEWLNAGKRDIAINLKTEAGKKIVYQLVESTDIFVTNFLPAAIERLGMDYDTLSKINPRLIYAQGTGFGPKGPQRNRRSFDECAFWTRSGIMSTLGEPDDPPVPLRGAMGDLTTATCLASAVVTALLARERFGMGQRVDASLYAAGLWVADGDVQRRLTLGDQANNRKVSRTNAGNPLRNTYQTKDGTWLFFMMMQTDRFWPAVCRAIGREELENDPRFDTHLKRIENSPLVVSILDEVLATRTMEEWAKRFDEYDLAWEPETSVADAVSDPQVAANDYVGGVEISSGEFVKILRIPFQLGAFPALNVRSPAPELGQHTEEVLLEMGYDWEKITELKEQGVII